MNFFFLSHQFQMIWYDHLRALLFSSIFVLAIGIALIIFFVQGIGVGFHPALNSSGGGMIMSS